MTTLVVGDKSGQLGNQLILFAHLVAFAEEYGWRLKFTGFHEHRFSFVGPSQASFARFPLSAEAASLGPPPGAEPSGNFRHKVTNWLCRILRRTEFLTGRLASTITCRGHSPDFDIDLAENDYVEQIQRAPLTILFGWRFRNYDLFEKHESTIRSYLSYKPRLAVDDYLSHIRETAETIVAVHIRHGDYKNYEGGKFYFSLETYIDWMRRCSQIMPGKRIAFILFSNEPVTLDAFSGLNVYKAPGGVIDDQYAMSRVDYIIGPPSTFSRWASFIGRVPFGEMQHGVARFNLDHFSVAKR